VIIEHSCYTLPNPHTSILVLGFAIQKVVVYETQLWNLRIFFHSIDIDLKESVKIMGYGLF
jgi:hypothetical protein